MEKSHCEKCVVVRYEDYLTETKVQRGFAAIEPALVAGGPKGLIVDVTGMRDYDAPARRAFEQWISSHGSELSGIAIVTNNRVWRIVIASIALVTRKPMKACTSFDEAHAAVAG